MLASFLLHPSFVQYAGRQASDCRRRRGPSPRPLVHHSYHLRRSASANMRTSNHVYFTDDCVRMASGHKRRSGKMGVFNLGVSPRVWSNWPPPLWITPNPMRMNSELHKFSWLPLTIIFFSLFTTLVLDMHRGCKPWLFFFYGHLYL
jgi:hypothetical protein